MCGIGGYRTTDGGIFPAERLKALDHAMVHRGPDQGGVFHEAGIGLVIRRLCVIDLATGEQPITNEDGSVVTVFNGEIYNHRELRQDLESRGHTFRSQADTEVIVHLYEEYGDDFLHHLRGMFAIAVWDRPQQRLLLARDRLGIKPLYYHQSGTGLTFASEIQALLAAGVPDEVNLEGLGAYFRLGYIPSPATAYQGIHSLPPGWRLTVESFGVKADRWWTLSRGEGRPVASMEEAQEELKRLVKESIQLRLLSDVPLGAFLSGGLDSTLVVGVMSELLDRPVETFTIGFDEAGFDETPLSREASRLHGTSRHEETIDSGSLDVLDDLLAGMGQPFADPSAVPTLLVSRLARRHVTVALSGDGGDELFGGYTRYEQARVQRWYDMVPRGLRAGLASSWPRGVRGAGALRIAAEDFGGRYVESGSLTTPAEREAWLESDLACHAAADPFRLAEPLVRTMRDGLTGVEDLLRLDLHSYLPDVILAKVDRMSMSCSLEARVPLLDHKVVEFVDSLPLEWRMGSKGSKKMMRQTFAGYYPAAITNRGKMGFGIPVGAWLGGPLRERVASLPDAESVRSGPLKAAGIRRLVDEHLTGRRDRGRKLWALMVFDAWWRGRSRPAVAAQSGGGPA